jgi:hypothetical protein
MRHLALATLALASCLFLPAPTAQAVSPSFQKDCEALTSTPHRLAGTKEAAQASDYVVQRLQGLEPDRLIVQPFATTQTQVHTCEVTVGGRTIQLLPMRPNGIIAPVTPPEGITGKLVRVGKADASAFARKSVKNCIVVMDYNTGETWMRAFRLGARAVIFTRNGPAEAANAHCVESSANLARYYYDGPASDFPEDEEATVKSSVTWEWGEGRNIIAFFKGTAPKFSDDKSAKEELVLLAANIDSFGEVPRLSPGARGATNCAGLLKLAEYIKLHRPRRHTLIVFYDNQARCHAGASEFYRALEDDKEEHTVEARIESAEAERTFLDEITDLANSKSPLTTDSPARRQLLERLANKGKARAEFVKDEAYKLRDEKLQYTKKYGDEFPPEVEARIKEIDDTIENDVLPRKDGWNALQRVIGRLRRTFGVSGEAIQFEDPRGEKDLQTILTEIRTDLDLRSKELDFETRALHASKELKDLIGEQWLCLHASLILGDTSDRWGLVIGGESAIHSPQDNPGLYGKIQSVFVKAYDIIGGKDGANTLFLRESADQTLPQTRVLWGVPFLVHSGEVAGLFGIYNLVFGTVQEGLPREGTPDDTLANLNLDRIERQVDDIAKFIAGPADVPAEGAGSVTSLLADLDTFNARLKDSKDDAETDAIKSELETFRQDHPVLAAVSNQEGLSLRRGIVAGKEYYTPKFEDDSVHAPMVMGLLPGNPIPNTPMPGATVQFRLRASYTLAYNPNKPFGFDNFQVLRTTRNGAYGLGPVTGGGIWNSRGGFAAVFDSRGEITNVSDQDSYKKIRWRLNVFRARPGMAVLPPQLRTDRLPGEEVKVMSARANAQLDIKKSFTETADGVVTWYSDEREKAVKLFSLRQFVGLNNGPETFDPKAKIEHPNGIGFSMFKDDLSFDVPARSASDLWRLNESRLAILRAKGIQDSSLAELHGRSEDLLIEAQSEHSPLRRESLSTSSFWSSQPVYTKVRSMLDDLVFAVLILLALSVPFAFALERVIIGATTIYRQICWFGAFFAMTFIILYLSHPAFAIANTPIIIFLGFAILVMAVGVICIIMRKFEFELKALQGMTATVHAADVSSISTFMAAMHMGISTMRRRPMRTALTAVTIILLTFTILCFASFGTQSGIVTLFSAPNPSYSGIFVHNVNWNPLSQDLAVVIKGRWRKRVQVSRRFWISPKTQDNPGLLVSLPDGTKPVTIRGVLGLDANEFAERTDLTELFGTIGDDDLVITSAVARHLGVDVGDKVLLKGRLLTIRKLMDAVQVSASKDMDTSSILPADFTEASSTQQTNTDGDDEAELMTQRNWASLPVDSVAIVSATTAQSLGASLYGMMLYTTDNAEAVEIAEELARMLPFPIAATRENGVFRHILGTVLKASGARDLFFPILLGGLVIFGTMLGSVADRQKEIYTFSALGLAPKHVATLFFAESMVYSLIGGLGGYLLAQGTMKILTVLSERGVVRVPEMNMSSTNTIVTILIVMATVLVSAIYPAIKASKSANPGLMRMWRPPDPDGDTLDLVFPFTVSAYDITGVVSFLKEHFGNHTDTGLGQFMTSNVQLVKEVDESLGLDAQLALAPFDLGVSQTFALRSAASEIPGIDEVRVILKRLSGQPKDWRRLNKVFLDDLRQQFLIWRSIPHETMELYRERTLTAFGEDGNDVNTPSEDA